MTYEAPAPGVQLYCGDFMNVLQSIDGFDHVITDPPYEAEAHTLQRPIQTSGVITSNPLEFDAISEDERIGLCEFATRCDGWLIAFCQVEAVAQYKTAMKTAGVKYKRAGVWVKPDGKPQFSGDRPGMGYESIVFGWCGDGKSKWNGGGKHGVYTFNKGDRVRFGHQTQKPIALMRKLIADFTKPGDVVLDPFMGSGTTGAACVELGREFIGIEINPDYYKIACERISMAGAQQRLFA